MKKKNRWSFRTARGREINSTYLLIKINNDSSLIFSPDCILPRRHPPTSMAHPPHRAPRPRTGFPPCSLLRSVHPLFRLRRRPSWWPLELPVALWAPIIAATRAELSPSSLRLSPGHGKTRHKAERCDKGAVRRRVSACVSVFFASNNNSPLLTAALSSQGERRRLGGVAGKRRGEN